MNKVFIQLCFLASSGNPLSSLSISFGSFLMSSYVEPKSSSVYGTLHAIFVPTKSATFICAILTRHQFIATQDNEGGPTIYRVVWGRCIANDIWRCTNSWGPYYHCLMSKFCGLAPTFDSTSNKRICLTLMRKDKDNSYGKWLKGTTCSCWTCTIKGQPHGNIRGPKL